MRSWLLLSTLCASAASATVFGTRASIQKRDSSVCTDLTVSSNNGDRKVAIVIDSSGSMVYNDPSNLRIAAGRALADFLISNSEATGGKKPDQLTVIDFDDSAEVDYPLGDPAGANSSFSKIDSFGGTYIADGVRQGILQLTAASAGATDKRSAIVVFTDGEDSSTAELVSAINNATALGIRVSFGFLDSSLSVQPKTVLQAIKQSKGVYATVAVAAGSQNFINYVLLNGLTANDNPQGYDSQLLAGLAETQFISGSSSVTLKYQATQGEKVNFTTYSISAGPLSVSLQQGGQELNKTTSLITSTVGAVAPNNGEMQLIVTANNAVQDSMFSVLTNSNVPLKNCTVGVATDTNSSGLSAGAKAGIGIGVTAAILGLLGAGGYFAWKQGWFGGGGGSGATAPTIATGGEAGNAGGYQPGAEKPMFGTDVYPVDPGSMSPGLTGTSPGFDPSSMSQGFTNSTPGSYPPMNGMAPASGFDPTSVGQSIGNSFAPGSPPVAPTSPFAPGAPTVGPPPAAYGVSPLAMLPPMVPPAKGGNNTSQRDGNKEDQSAQQLGNMPPQGYEKGFASGQTPTSTNPNALQSGSQYNAAPGSQNTAPGGQYSEFAPGQQSTAPGYNVAPGAQHPLGPNGQPTSTPGSYGHGPGQPTATPQNLAPGGQPSASPGPSQYTLSPGPDGYQHYQPSTSPNPSTTGTGPGSGYQSPYQPSVQQPSAHPGYPSVDPGQHSYPSAVDPSASGPQYAPGHVDMPGQPGFNQAPSFQGYQGQAPIGSGDGHAPYVPNPTAPKAEIPKVSEPFGAGGSRHNDVEKHHHHEYLPAEKPCEDPKCPLNHLDHRCSPDSSTCPCTCRDQNCVVYKRKL